MDSPPVTLLQYAGRNAAPLRAARRTVLFWIAIACWLLPLLAGLAITLALEIFELVRPLLPKFDPQSHSHPYDVLLPGGALNILVGTLLAGVGCVMVLAFVLTRWSAAVDRWREVVRPALTLLLLLASNFGVALLLTWIVMR